MTAHRLPQVKRAAGSRPDPVLPAWRGGLRGHRRATMPAMEAEGEATMSNVQGREEPDRKRWERLLRRKPERCSACGSAKVAYVLWGLPAPSTDELLDLVDEGTVILAGCLIPPGPARPP